MEDQAAFDTSLSGVPVARWLRWMEAWPLWQPAPAPLVIVAPHPDDETLGAGGLIYTWSRRRLPVTVILLTDGEAACPEIPGLAARRYGELQASLRQLGASQAQIVRLQLADGHVSAHDASVARHLQDHLQPGSLLLAPCQFDGHPDHDAAGRAAIAAAAASQATLLRYPVWSWYRGPTELWATAQAVRFPLGAAAWAAKQRALAEFRSQLADRAAGPIVPPHVLSYFQHPHEVFLT